MSWAQNSAPNLGTQDNPGWCLRFVQSVYNSPVAYPSATAAWNATGQKYFSRDMPSVSVPVWFSCVLDLGDGPQDWGHVAAWVPERGQFLSSPMYWSQGYGQSWVNSLEDFERILGASYVGFSADLNGLQIATYTDDGPAPAPSRSYTVVPGDTLWGIAQLYYGDGTRYPEIAAANGIENPNLIYPGQVFIIP